MPKRTRAQSEIQLQSKRLSNGSSNSEFPKMEKPALRPESTTSRRRHTRLQPCKRCVALARQVLPGSPRLSLSANLRDLDKLLHKERAASLNAASLDCRIFCLGMSAAGRRRRI